MSRQEQRALVAFVNTFKLSKRITGFEQLADGKALLEVMSSIDATHFKQSTTRGPNSSPSPENWVLKMNTLKRLYRLLLSYPLPSPHPANLSASTLPDPPFSTIAKSTTTSEGIRGLLQICRMCLALGVWASGNEKVIAKIQGLEEGSMAELMRSIEGVMATLPQEEVPSEEHSPPSEVPPEPRTPPKIRAANHDDIAATVEDLRTKCQSLEEQVLDLSNTLEETVADRNDALARLAARAESKATLGLRSSQTGTSEVDDLQASLLRSEENLLRAEADLEEQMKVVNDLNRQVTELSVEAAAAALLKDQLDEYRHTAERLQKSENVIEKYKRKLEDSAGLKKELRNLEEENASLASINATLEAERKKSGSSKALVDRYKADLYNLQIGSDKQTTEITDLAVQLQVTRMQLLETQQAHARDLEELERLNGSEPGTSSGMRRVMTMGKTTLDDELGDGEAGGTETKTELKRRIRALQYELAKARSSSDDQGGNVAELEAELASTRKARDRYQADYVIAQHGSMRAEASLEAIRSGRSGTPSEVAAALREKLDEVVTERDEVVRERDYLETAKLKVEKELDIAFADLDMVDTNQKQIVASIRERETSKLEQELAALRDEISALRDKDALRLEEIKGLLLDKVEIQSAGIQKRDSAIIRERQLGDLRERLAAQGVSPGGQTQMLELHGRNIELSATIEKLSGRLNEAQGQIREQDTSSRSEFGPELGEDAATARKQIKALRSELEHLKESSQATEKRYKLEQQLMLSAWHDLSSHTVREHVNTAVSKSRGAAKPMPSGWLGRQRRYQEEAAFSR